MLLKKITEYREYRKALKDVKKCDDMFITSFKEFIFAHLEISLTRDTKKEDAKTRPDDSLFGTEKYPCIINNNWESLVDYGEEIDFDCGKETHCCKRYTPDTVCSKQHCPWHKKNEVVVNARKKWEMSKQASEQATKKLKETYRAFFGERLYKRAYGE